MSLRICTLNISVFVLTVIKYFALKKMISYSCSNFILNIFPDIFFFEIKIIIMVKNYFKKPDNFFFDITVFTSDY